MEGRLVGVDYKLGFWYSHGVTDYVYPSNITKIAGISYFRGMWQRIQTLYLVVATALVVTLFFSVKSFTVGTGGAHVDEVKYVAFIPYLILLVVVGLLQLISLMAFKVRVFQMRTAVLAALVLLGLQGWLVFDYLVAAKGVLFSWTAILPLIAAILDFMAARRIFRDQLLVESSTRLRSRK